MKKYKIELKNKIITAICYRLEINSGCISVIGFFENDEIIIAAYAAGTWISVSYQGTA